MNTFDRLATEIYEQNKAVGWWDNPDRCIYETLQLVSTEIAEATEGERKDLMDDHLPHRKMGEVELADAMIRMLDIGGRYGWKTDGLLVSDKGMPIFSTPGAGIAKKHFFLNRALVALSDQLTGRLEDPTFSLRYAYATLLYAIEAVAKSQGYDVFAALKEKLAYNRERADHKRENRAKPGGKAF